MVDKSDNRHDMSIIGKTLNERILFLTCNVQVISLYYYSCCNLATKFLRTVCT